MFMKRILTGMLAGAALLTLSCGEEEVEIIEQPPVWERPAASTTRKVTPRPGNQPRDHINTIRKAKNINDRIIGIRRAGRVEPKDRKDMVPILIRMLQNAPNSVEKAAAAQALIEIGTDTALTPVKKALVLGVNQVLNSGIMEKLRRKHGPGYKNVIKAWCLELLNDPAAMTVYKENQIISGLNMFNFVYIPRSSEVIDPTIYLQDKSSRILSKIYELLETYPPDKMPTGTIRNRLETQFNKKDLNLREARAVMGMLRTKQLDPLSLRLSLKASAISWGLNFNDFEVREATLVAIRLSWRGFSEADRKAIKAQVKDLVKNDRTWIEGEFVIQERARETLRIID